MRNTVITKEVQGKLTPQGVLEDLLEGNEKYIKNKTITTKKIEKNEF